MYTAISYLLTGVRDCACVCAGFMRHHEEGHARGAHGGIRFT